MTRPARTLLDLAATLDGAAAASGGAPAQGRRRVNLRQLLEVLVAAAARRGCARLARAIATGPAPTKSVLEDIVLDLFARRRFAHPDVNQPLLIGGRRVIPDFRWPEQRLVIEADGAAWHDDPIARADDVERQALLEAHGERVLRVTWQQAVTDASARAAAGSGLRDVAAAVDRSAEPGSRRLRACADPTNAATPSSRSTSATSPGGRSTSCSTEAKPFTRELAEGTDAQLAALDEEIARLSRGWELDRIAALERSIMRVALYEMRDGRPGRGRDRRGGQPGEGVLRRRRARVRQRDPRLGRARARRRRAP